MKLNEYKTHRFDQHLHSVFSCDAANDCTIDRIVETAVKTGLSGIALTDHFDPCWPDEGSPMSLDIPAYEAALTEAGRLYADRIRFAKGIELGILPGETLDICREVVSGYPYDFVIASVHYNDYTPIDYPPFFENRPLKDTIEEYYTILLESIRAYKDYDVLGHLNSIDRYTGELAPEEMCAPYVDEILKVVVSDGKGLEINTSARRFGISERGTPPVSVLKRYRELGGEIVTTGSDAHRLSNIGAYLEEGEETLRACGFEYAAFFSERRPEFFRL